jgi:hypothetical protein
MNSKPRSQPFSNGLARGQDIFIIRATIGSSGFHTLSFIEYWKTASKSSRSFTATEIRDIGRTG